MSLFADPTICPATAADTLTKSFKIHSTSHPEALEVTHPKESKEFTFWEKDVGNPPSTSHNEAQDPPTCLDPDSLEDILVEKWVDELSNRATDDVVATVFRHERASSVRFSPLGSRSKENRKNRSSASYTAVLPYKRDIPRNALVQLRYRHYCLKSVAGDHLRYQNPKTFAYTLTKVPSAVPREQLFPHELDQCSPLEQRTPQAYLEWHNRVLDGYLPAPEGRAAFTTTTGDIILDELDLEWTRERFAQASLGDDYDSDMTG